MPIRNPFARSRPVMIVSNDENVRPANYANDAVQVSPPLNRGDTFGSIASSALSIRSRQSQDTGEYKMSVVNDSGVYLPPSPSMEKGAWPRKYLATRTSTETWSSVGEIEHFSISRESFDSYRRSFDITAKSAVLCHGPSARQSFESVHFGRMSRPAVADRRALDLEPGTDEDFEDVGLGDPHHAPVATRRRGFFSKFSDTQDAQAPASTPTSSPVVNGPSTVTRFLIPGRKRTQSQGKDGAELGTIQRPLTAIGSGGDFDRT